MAFLRLVSSYFLITALTFNSAYAGSACVRGLRDVLRDGPNTPAPRPTRRRKDPFKKYRQFENPQAYAAKKQKLLDSLEFWRQFGRRDITMLELKRNEIRSLLEEAFKMDGAHEIALKFRPLFFKVQLAFYSFRRNNRIIDRLERAVGQLNNGQITQARRSLELIKERENYDISSNEKSSLLQEIQKLKDENTSHAEAIANNVDQYSEAVYHLGEKVKNGGPVGEIAQRVERKLQGRFVVDSFLGKVNRSNEPTPLVREIRQVVDASPIAEIRQLEKARSAERWTSVVSRLPTTEIKHMMDRILAKIPWLNTSAMRRYLRETVDNKEIYSHYPNIDRMSSNGSNTPKEMWDYMKIVDARTNGSNSFLETFARRIDTREQWRQVIEYGEKRAEKLRQRGHPRDPEVRLHERMKNAEIEAAKLHPLRAWHHPKKSAVVRFLVDGLMVVSMALAASFGMDFFNRVVGEATEDEQEQVRSAVDSVLRERLPEANR